MGKNGYPQASIRNTLVGNEIIDHSDVVGAPPVGPAPTTSSYMCESLKHHDHEMYSKVTP